MWGHWYLVLVLTAEGISFWEPRSCSSLASSLRPAIPLLPCAHAEAQVPCLAPPDTARLVQSVGDGPGQATATYIQCFVCVIIISLNLLAISYEDCYSFGHPGPQGKGVNRWGAPPPPQPHSDNCMQITELAPVLSEAVMCSCVRSFRNPGVHMVPNPGGAFHVHLILDAVTRSASPYCVHYRLSSEAQTALSYAMHRCLSSTRPFTGGDGL